MRLMYIPLYKYYLSGDVTTAKQKKSYQNTITYHLALNSGELRSKKEEDELPGRELSCSNGCSLYFQARQDWAYGTK